MKNILLVCPKPYCLKIVEKYLQENYPNYSFAYDFYPFITEANCKPLALEKRDDGYYKENRKTNDFIDFVPKYPLNISRQYAIGNSQYIKNCYDKTIDSVLFIGCDFYCDILGCLEYCFSNNIPNEKAFHSFQVSFHGNELDNILNIDNIQPLFELADTIQF